MWPRGTTITFFCALLIVLCAGGIILTAAKATIDEINTIMLKLHNEMRQKVLDCKLQGQPQAKEMKTMVFDAGLAGTAKKWADQCKRGHDELKDRVTPDFTWVGQNFAGAHDFLTAFNLWADEYKLYTYANNSCQAGKQCGHYTQVVWANSHALGCAFKECDRTATGFPYGKSIVCNYGPGGNLGSAKPYQLGAHEMCPPSGSESKPDTSSQLKQSLWTQLSVVAICWCLISPFNLS